MIGLPLCVGILDSKATRVHVMCVALSAKSRAIVLDERGADLNECEYGRLSAML